MDRLIFIHERVPAFSITDETSYDAPYGIWAVPNK